jgi:hypothetical protein
MSIIGLSGYARSGKDSAAAILVDECGFTRVAFADVLRDMAYAIDPYVQLHNQDSFGRLSTIIDIYGWDRAKTAFPDVRRFLQRLGTEGGRDILGENIWVDTAFARAPSDKLVITDLRFPNEVDAVKARGGTTARIHRPGVAAPNNHASEHSLDGISFDYNINNDGSLEDFRMKILELV